MSLSKKARREFLKFLKGKKNIGKSIFFAGTYEKMNGVNNIHLDRELRYQRVGDDIMVYEKP